MVARIRVRRKMVRYVLIIPRVISFVTFAITVCVSARPFGPMVSSHVLSSWVAADCPRVSLSFGRSRWVIAGKNPSMFEKWCGRVIGTIFTCLLVMLASPMAVNKPRMVTVRAAILRVVGMVMTGVFIGIKLWVIINPAIILPQASRLMELITSGLFSLIGERGRNRGVPIVTKYTSRKL